MKELMLCLFILAVTVGSLYVAIAPDIEDARRFRQTEHLREYFDPDNLTETQKMAKDIGWIVVDGRYRDPKDSRYKK